MNDSNTNNQVENNEIKKTSSMRKSFQTKKFRSGAYVSIISAIVVILVIVANLFVTDLNIKYDVSEMQYFTLSDATKDVLKNIEDDIVIYYIAKSGEEDELQKNIVDRYEQLSSHITIEVKDPVLYPKLAADYTQEEIGNNSILVVNKSNNRGKYISEFDLYAIAYDYVNMKTYKKGIDVEGELTSALLYVTSENMPIIYITTGHGEEEPSSQFIEAVGKQNYELKALNTLSADKIPEDCSVLLINGLVTDITNDEYDIIFQYLSNGGNLVINVDPLTQRLENATKLLEYYGIATVDGYILEGNTSYMVMNVGNYLLPELLTSDITKAVRASQKSVLMQYGVGLVETDLHRSTITIEPLMKTSTSSFSKVDLQSTTSVKDDNDIDGPFFTGIKSSDTFNGVTSNVFVFGSRYIFDKSISNTYGNYDLFIQAASSMTGKEASINIPAKSFSSRYLTLNQRQTVTWGVIVIGVIPVGFLVAGIIIYLRRRKR